MKKINKPDFISEQEKTLMEKAVFEEIIKDRLHSIPAHKHADIKIRSIEPTLRGIYVVWSECGTLQRFARTFEYKEMNELTKEFQYK